MRYLQSAVQNLKSKMKKAMSNPPMAFLSSSSCRSATVAGNGRAAEAPQAQKEQKLQAKKAFPLPCLIHCPLAKRLNT